MVSLDPHGTRTMKSMVIANLWMEYRDQVVLERINLNVRRKEFITIVGASGCGKTTFLRILLGEERPSRGRVLIDDKPLCPEPGPERGVVFQRYSVFEHLTVLENVMLGPELARARVLGHLFGAARRRVRKQAEMMLDAVGLSAAQEKFPAALSGGMQQRLAIAQSLIMEPEILLLDEPFGALDPGIRNDMHRLILGLWAEREMSVFMITHDIKEAFALGTRLLVFDKPRVDIQAPGAYGATVTYDIPLQSADERAYAHIQQAAVANGAAIASPS